MTKEQFLQDISARLRDISTVDKDVLDMTFPNGAVRAYYCVRRWTNANGGTCQFYVLNDRYFIDLTITSNSISIRQTKLHVESIEKTFKIERLLQVEVEPATVILRLKDMEPINLMKPERAEMDNYRSFLRALLDI
jgi:hypothetical protein